MAAMRQKYVKKMRKSPLAGDRMVSCFRPQAGSYKESGSRPVSRVLSWAIIHLGPPSPAASCDLPESAADHGIAFLFGLAPGGVYLATECCHLRGALLPHHFTLTGPILANRTGGIFSVALSVGSRPPGVTWHPALWSPDFPPHHEDGAIAWPTPGYIVSYCSSKESGPRT
jgi:hypothetical protein